MNCHDRIIGNLERIVRKTTIKGRNEEYGTDSRIVGEIDYFMYNKDVLFIFEIKSNYKHELRDKAIVQLNRAMNNPIKTFLKHFEEKYGIIPDKVRNFYVTRTGKGRFQPVLEYINGLNNYRGALQ